MNRQTGEGNFFESESSRSRKAKGGCTMSLMEFLALLTFVFTTIYETVDITLKIVQYMDEKRNKKD